MGSITWRTSPIFANGCRGNVPVRRRHHDRKSLARIHEARACRRVRGNVETGAVAGHQQSEGLSWQLSAAQERGAEVEFITIIFWDSTEAIRAMTGPDYEASIIPEERRKYLSKHDAKAKHYEVASTHGLPD